MPSDPKKNITKSALLKQWRNRKKKVISSHSISPRPRDVQALASSGQQRLWLLQKLYPENPFYQYAHLYKIEGELNIEFLTQSFQQLIERHEILRTNFEENENGLNLKINPTPNFKIKKIELSKNDISNEKAYPIAQEEATKTFDLANDFLLRITVLKFSDSIHWMVLSIHHIIGDRSSLLIINEEIFSTYQKLVNSNNLDFAPLPIQYADFAYWHNNKKTSDKNLNYWLDQLAGELPTLDLPTDYSRPKHFDFSGMTISKKLSPSLSKALQALAKENDTTMYVVLLAAFQLLLYRYTNQSDILVGSPFINRDKVELEKLIGFFNETLVLRTQLSDQLNFKQLIVQVKETTMHAFEHRDMPFDELVQSLKIKRQGNRNPLFQTMFVYNNSNTSTAIDLDLKIEEETLELGVSKFDLTFFATDHQDYLEIAFEFSLEIFEEDSILRMQNHLEVILNAIATDANQLISKIPLLTKSEQKQILVDWNDTKIPIPKYQAIHHLIEEMALKFPEKIAVIFEDQKITYAQLDQKSNYVATLLSKTTKVESTIVGLFVERSIEMIIGILGILKAGAAYLPLDAEYPKERIEFMLADAKVNVVLCQTELKGQANFSDVEVLEINISEEASSSNSLKPKAFSKDSLAYMIYTSGSTGQPKGVPISHQNLIHSTTARFHFFEKQPDAFLLLSSFSFDSSVAGIFWTLCSGGTLVIAKKRIEQDINALSNIIHNNNITHTLLLPSLYHLLLQHASIKKLDSLNTVMVAGEVCSSNLLSLHFEQLAKVALVNEYGPTEGTVWSTAHQLSPKDAFGAVPIGRAIPNVQNYILDKNLQAVPIGVIGELYIGGAGVANTYWNRAELSKTKFLPNPFCNDGKALLYKTGDLARFRKNGVIYFLGRADHQVKIRGHRIELDEIKTRFLQIDSIQDAIVLIQKPKKNPQIIAYLITKGNQDFDYKNSLKEKLPDYMIPSAFILLDKFPKLPNGKIDLAKLPKPEESVLNKTTDFVAPRSAIEKQLVSIWEEVLKIKPISIHSNFFELGGDSIRSIQVISKAYKQGIEIAPQSFFEYQNIETLAYFLEKNNNSSTNQDSDSNSSTLVPLNKRGTKSPLFCIHSGGAHVFFYRALASHLGSNQTMYALQPLGLDGKEKIHSSIEEMASFYIQEMQKVQPTGPYHLLGTCFSNAVGLEMANQLKSEGEEIASLIFVDSGPQYLLGAKLRGERKTAKRFAQMIKEKNWKAIQRKFRNRWIRSKQKVLAPFENKQERNLRLTISNLNHLYNYYTWKAFDGKIIFIRSTEFANRADKNTHITQWTKLAKGGLEVHVIEGHHKTLFAAPEVKGLAKKIEELLKLNS